MFTYFEIFFTNNFHNYHNKTNNTQFRFSLINFITSPENSSNYQLQLFHQIQKKNNRSKQHPTYSSFCDGVFSSSFSFLLQLFSLSYHIWKPHTLINHTNIHVILPYLLPQKTARTLFGCTLSLIGEFSFLIFEFLHIGVFLLKTFQERWFYLEILPRTNWIENQPSSNMDEKKPKWKTQWCQHNPFQEM